MTDSESRFRSYLKERFPGGFVRKLPDFKQAGFVAGSGLPDYLVIDNGFHYWFEVKSCVGDTLSRRHFTPAQLVTFNKMFESGVDVEVGVFSRSFGLVFVSFSAIVSSKSVKLYKQE